MLALTTPIEQYTGGANEGGQTRKRNKKVLDQNISNRRQHHTANKFSKMEENNANIQKLIMFLYTSKE